MGTDMYGANYTTRPIELPNKHFGLTQAEGAKAQRYADDMEEALESLPNFAIPNVTVSASCSGASGGVCTNTENMLIQVEFVDPANSGPQNLLKCSYASATDDINNKDIATPYNYGAAQPRFVSPFLANTEFVCTATHPNVAATKEHVECSNRGTCDGSSGMCDCYDGFTGEACSTQTVFF